jgi:hypothetical protein
MSRGAQIGFTLLYRSEQSWQRMCLQPQRARGGSGIDTDLVPLCCFIAAAVDLAMMPPAQRHGEFVADFSAKRPRLRKSQMVGIGGTRPQTRHGCWATDLTCSRSRIRRGAVRAAQAQSYPRDGIAEAAIGLSVVAA